MRKRVLAALVLVLVVAAGCSEPSISCVTVDQVIYGQGSRPDRVVQRVVCYDSDGNPVVPSRD
jgi:hypothetical protein